MSHVCPQCGSYRIRRVSSRSVSRKAWHLLRSPYRCRRCDAHFWAVSTGTWLKIAAWTFVAPLVGAAWYGWTIASRREDDLELAILLEHARARDGAEEYQTAQKYLKGDGVPAEPREGYALLERAAQLGHAKAQFELALALRAGTGAQRDDERAVTWLRSAAEAGDPHAQFELGFAYLQGQGTPVDRVRGYAWLAVAAAQGFVGAVDARDEALRGMTPAEATYARAEARRMLDGRVAATRTEEEGAAGDAVAGRPLPGAPTGASSDVSRPGRE